jgi:hypothetical protein
MLGNHLHGQEVERIFDQVQLVSNANLRAEWHERAATQHGRAVLIDLLRVRLLEALAPASSTRTAAEARIEYWKSQHISRLCRELLEQLDGSAQSIAPEGGDASGKVSEPCLQPPVVTRRAILAIDELQRTHEAVSASAASRVEMASKTERRKRTRARQDVITNLVEVYECFWDRPTASRSDATNQARDQPLLRFIQLTLLTSTGRMESRSTIREALSFLRNRQ